MIESGFGLARIKREGTPAHPDDYSNTNWKKDNYIKQLLAYYSVAKDETCFDMCIYSEWAKEARECGLQSKNGT